MKATPYKRDFRKKMFSNSLSSPGALSLSYAALRWKPSDIELNYGGLKDNTHNRAFLSPFRPLRKKVILVLQAGIKHETFGCWARRSDYTLHRLRVSNYPTGYVKTVSDLKYIFNIVKAKALIEECHLARSVTWRYKQSPSGRPTEITHRYNI